MADAIGSRLPSRLAYRLADLGGDAWRRFAPERQRLVAANLARVSRATGRPDRGPALQRLVRDAFRAHARYYLELLRYRSYGPRKIDEHIAVDDWPRLASELRGQATIVAVPHLGNFEPLGNFLAKEGLPALAPIEEIEPPELFEFVLARRAGGTGHVTIVPLARARRPMLDALKRGEIVALIADRDLSGDGLPVTFFGSPTTMPAGPATLALLSGARLMTARVLRAGPDRFHVRGEWLDWTPGPDRRADIAAITQRIAERFEAAIAEAPEQWWGAFQPIWPDMHSGDAAAGAATDAAAGAATDAAVDATDAGTAAQAPSR
jgi:KDO2-lipid IV(A) lauroyltransferase